MSEKEHAASLDKRGRIFIPARLRRALGLETGVTVFLFLEQGELLLVPLRRRLAKAQQTVRRHVSRSVSLVDELIAERREEARRE